MIEARVKLLNGDYITMYANNHIELFAQLDAEQIDELETKPIRLKDIRQGKETKKEVPQS